LALNLGDTISQNRIFNPNSAVLFGVANTGQVGNWPINNVDKYLGVKFKISGNTHYAWVRLSVNYVSSSNMSVTIKDFAYQSTPNTLIKAGDTLSVAPVNTASIASSVVATDIADNNNGSDMKVAFTKATNENTIDKYRIMVVKAANASTFNIDSANNVVAANYKEITPTGNNIIDTLSTTAKDVKGNPITNGVAYKVFVMSKADGTNATINSLSQPSNTITLQSVAASTALSVVASDIADNNNGSDMKVAFTKAANENTIDKYRIMVVKAANASTFNINSANNVVAANYKEITPNGNNIIDTLSAMGKDVNGDPIANGVAYKVFVYSKADGTNATVNSLSTASNTITLQSIAANKATSVVASDIGNNNNASDMKVIFNKATNENSLSEYRIMIVKLADAAAFDIAKANAVTIANCQKVTPNGSNYSIVLASGTKDVDGNAIANLVDYKVFIFSKADGTNATVNSLSQASNTIKLIDDTGIEEFDKANINLFPNPVSDFMTIEMPTTGCYNIQIIDINGKVVFEKRFEGLSTKISVSDFVNGNYFVFISDKKQNISKKIIVKKK